MPAIPTPIPVLTWRLGRRSQLLSFSANLRGAAHVSVSVSPPDAESNRLEEGQGCKQAWGERPHVWGNHYEDKTWNYVACHCGAGFSSRIDGTGPWRSGSVWGYVSRQRHQPFRSGRPAQF